MFAEDLVDLLAEKGLVSPDLVKGLQNRLAATPKTVSAEIFADRLVEQGVLTTSLARALLRQLQPQQEQSTKATISSTNLPPASPVFPPPPVPQQKQQRPSTPISPTQQSVPFPAAHKEVVPSLEKLTKDRIGDNTQKIFPAKKRRRHDQWDTKLILFGLTALLALFLLALFFGSSLLRRSADSMLSKANQEYEKAAYSQAIFDYGEYLKTFPNHSGVPVAKIRSALSKIRLLVDSKSDWLKTYDTMTQEIEGVENEPSFFDESKSELSVLLPKIASGLAKQAKEKESLFHAERAEQTLTQIERLLPRSLRPTEQISEINSQIQEVRRLVFCDNALKETTEKVDSLLRREDFDAKNLSQCQKTIASLLDVYPELSVKEHLIELLVRLSESESRAARIIAPEVNQQEQNQSEKGDLSENVPSKVRILATLYDRPKEENILTPDLFPCTILCAKNRIYGIGSTNGIPLWSLPSHCKSLSALKILPVFQSKTMPKTSFILSDEQNQRLLLLDAETGKKLDSYIIGEPFFLSAVEQDDLQNLVAATTRSGRLIVLSILPESLEEKQIIQLPQSVDSAPLIISQDKKTICQLAERNTVYVIPIDNPQTIRSFYVGQKPSTIRIAPVCIGTNLLIVRQTGVRNCELIVCNLNESGGGKIRQVVPIRGLVDAEASISPPFLALLSDESEVMLIQFEDGPKPLRLLASGAVGNDIQKKGNAQYLTLLGKNIWLADWQLMKFDFQPAQSRLLPGPSIRRNIVTIGPMFRIKDLLFHSFYDPTSKSFCLQAVSTSKNFIEWETELADGIVAEPFYEENENTQNLIFFSAGGKAWTIEVPGQIDEQKTKSDELNLTIPTRRMPKGAFGQNSLGRILFLKDGYQLWIPDLNVSSFRTENRKLLLYDPNAVENNRFRSIFLPTSLSADPVLMKDFLLTPLQDGRIVLVDPQDGKMITEPFAPLRSDLATPIWNTPLILPDGSRFLVADNRLDETGSALIHLAEFLSDGADQKLELRKSFLLENTADSNLIQFGKDRIAFVDRKNVLRIVNLKEFDNTPEGQDIVSLNFEKSEQLSAKCAWGPFLFDETLLCVDENSKMYAMPLNGDLISAESPCPVGNAFNVGDGILLNTSQGKIWKINPTTLKTFFLIETGVQTKVGPFLIGNRIILSGSDGIVYEMKIPSMERSQNEKNP